MRNLDEIRRIKAEVEAELLKLPGVTAVDIGHKIVGGKKTDVLAIRVYVEKKKDVPEEEVVPKQIQGVPTDVIERRFVLHPGEPEETGQSIQLHQSEPVEGPPAPSLPVTQQSSRTDAKQKRIPSNQ